MARILELSDWKFKATMINMLKNTKDKVNSIQEQVGTISGEMKIL
jgi:hypothetical protein